MQATASIMIEYSNTLGQRVRQIKKQPAHIQLCQLIEPEQGLSMFVHKRCPAENGMTLYSLKHVA